MAENKTDEKPKRDYFKTYVQLIKNSVGSEMFRNFYVSTPERGEFDALDDGENSCAFYVSSVLVLFKKLQSVHGTVASTVKDLEESSWEVVGEPQPGDVILWKPKQFADGVKRHIGFYLGDKQAVSTSSKEKAVVLHEIEFGDEKRKFDKIYRFTNWDD